MIDKKTKEDEDYKRYEQVRNKLHDLLEQFPEHAIPAMVHTITLVCGEELSLEMIKDSIENDKEMFEEDAKKGDDSK